jgi:hypothetical protein
MKSKTTERKSATSQPVTTRVSVPDLRRAIQKLPADRPLRQTGVWYLTQKQHWLGWLDEYNTRGAYGRKAGMNRDARFAYNHIVCPPMLLWLASAAGVKSSLLRAAKQAAVPLKTEMAQAGAIRRHVPWEVVAEALWPRKTGSRQ